MADMAQRHGTGGPSAVPGPPGLPRLPGFETRFGAVLRADGGVSGPAREAERRAVAAFRAAREAGAHRARTRPRDDWAPNGRAAGSR
ncbi:hypothetical protein [Streptomyces sp. NPDC096012]|uniref:hypothetical protein n=1 Tax=Streptomyces sp. NPDC096012 TaxID=3155684 RepID=UPI003369D78A